METLTQEQKLSPPPPEVATLIGLLPPKASPAARRSSSRASTSRNRAPARTQRRPTLALLAACRSSPGPSSASLIKVGTSTIPSTTCVLVFATPARVSMLPVEIRRSLAPTTTAAPAAWPRRGRASQCATLATQTPQPPSSTASRSPPGLAPSLAQPRPLLRSLVGSARLAASWMRLSCSTIPRSATMPSS